MGALDFSFKRLCKWLHARSDEKCTIDASRKHGLRQAGMKGGACGTKFPHRAQHSNASRSFGVAKDLKRRGHRRRIGIVAFIDEQRVSITDTNAVVCAATRQTFKICKREASRRKIATQRIDGGQNGECI